MNGVRKLLTKIEDVSSPRGRGIHYQGVCPT